MIIPLEERHLDFIESARALGFTDGWNKDMVISSIKGGRLIGFIAQEKGESVGFIFAERGVDGDADIESVFTLPKMRNKGFAAELLSGLIESLEESGVSKIFLEVKESNIPARNLYSKFGFKELSLRKKYYSDGENAVVMKRG